MSLGMRHEVYNDHWGAWNWQKTIAFGTCVQPEPCHHRYAYMIHLGIVLLRALQEAREMAVKQRQIFVEYSATFTPTILEQWESMVAAWDADPSKPDPYEEPTTGAYSALAPTQTLVGLGA